MANSLGSSSLSSINFSGLKVAQVMDNYDKDGEGKIKVFIPSIQYDDSYDQKAIDGKDSVKSSNIANKKKISGGSVTQSNYIEVRPFTLFEEQKKSGNYRVPIKKSFVVVTFLDSDPQKGYYFPYNPTNDGDEITSKNAPSNWSDKKKRPNIRSEVLPNGSRIDIDWNEGDSSIIITIAPTTGKQMEFKMTEKGKATINGYEIVTEENFLKYLKQFHPSVCNY